MMDARSAAHLLGGRAFGNRVSAPGPGHAAGDASLSILFIPSAPDGFVVKSHSPRDDWQTCRDYVRGKLGLKNGSNQHTRRGGEMVGVAAPPSMTLSRAAEVMSLARRRARARDLWDEARSPLRSPVEIYLAGRALSLSEDVAGRALRYHARCPWRDEATGEIVRVPAMLAAMRDIHTDELRAVHVTRLTPEGRKLGRRMRGPCSGAAVKLDADEDVTMGLAIGEGIETTLAARQLGFRPAWALGSAGAIATFPLLSGIDALLILGETDDSGANAAAVEACAARWHAAGREVRVAAPVRGGDMNDVIVRKVR